MSLFKNKLIKWSFRIILVIVLIFAFWLSVAAFPQPLFKYKKQYGQCTVYSDSEFDDNFTSIMDDVNSRLSNNELHNEDKNSKVFLCHDQRLFSAFATISLLKPDIQGFNLSIMGNTFVCIPKIQALKESHGSYPKYNVREGNIAHTIAHEIIHEYTMDAIGFNNYRKLPVWKSEGYAEYGANCSLLRNDSILTFHKRIGIYLDDFNWDPGENWVRTQYQSALMIEYLSEIEGYTLEQIMDDTIQFSNAYNSMITWYNNQNN